MPFTCAAACRAALKHLTASRDRPSSRALWPDKVNTWTSVSLRRPCLLSVFTCPSGGVADLDAMFGRQKETVTVIMVRNQDWTERVNQQWNPSEGLMVKQLSIIRMLCGSNPIGDSLWVLGRNT